VRILTPSLSHTIPCLVGPRPTPACLRLTHYQTRVLLAYEPTHKPPPTTQLSALLSTPSLVITSGTLHSASAEPIPRLELLPPPHPHPTTRLSRGCPRLFDGLFHSPSWLNPPSTEWTWLPRRLSFVRQSQVPTANNPAVGYRNSASPSHLHQMHDQ
jgi:hypothetical protein